MPANVCLLSGDSLKRPAQFDRPTPLYRAATPPLSRPHVLATAFVRAVAFGQDRGRRKDAIHARKYGHLYPRPGRLGRMLARAMAQQRADQAAVSVVPVLLHQQKHEQRGFKRARALARNALSILKKSHPQWKLVQAPNTPLWQRWTESRAGLTARQLRLNMRGAFAVSDAQAVRIKHILLVDDILTASPTAREAARALLQPGAASATVVARARRLNERRDNANLQNKVRSSRWGPSGDGPDADGPEPRIESSDRSSQHQPSF